MFDNSYSKPFHISGSPSVFLDLDSLIYIVVSSTLVWLIVCAVKKIKGIKPSSYFEFIGKYMIVCALPVFIINLIMLFMNSKMIFTNCIICILPLLYGLVIQILFTFIRKYRRKSL